MIVIHISREHNKKMRGLVDEKCAAYKNWIVTAVEAGKTEYATQLVKELREYQEFYHVFLPDDMVKEE